MYSKEEEIIHFIFKAFYGMERVKEKIPVVFHSIIVGNMLKNEGLDDDIVYAGYLHDIIEDTQYNYNYLENHYGMRIAQYVLNVSDDKKILDFKERKNKFFDNLKKCDDAVIYIELADKLSNLLSDYEFVSKEGINGLYSESRCLEDTNWYYSEFQKIFNARIDKKSNLLKKYNDVMKLYFDNND